MMTKIEHLIRPNILKLKPYSSARDEFSGKEGIFLDANENPFGTLNRYPDPYQNELKQKLAVLKNLGTENIFVGNGSDEVIDLAYRIFCDPQKDKALTFSPSYGMYTVCAEINDVELLKIPLNEHFQINGDKLKPYLDNDNIKLIFICSPNNPTSNLVDKKDILFILENFKGVVVLDEAYIDFSPGASMLGLVHRYGNLIVSQTFSKARGLAAVRIGIAYGAPEIISFYNKVKPPYNVSQINQNAALESLKNYQNYEENLAIILSEKERLGTELQQIDIVKKIYPSDANFYLIEVNNADEIYAQLVDLQIVVRNRNKLVKNCIRISVGSPEENDILINALKNIS